MEEVKLNSKELLKEGNVSLILDSYHDIFSSFDPRLFSERALSDDFLMECKRAVRDKVDDDSAWELRLMVPSNKRSLSDESRIRIRLKSHFDKHYVEKLKEIKSVKREGIMWFFLGAVFIFFATLLYNKEGFLFNMIQIMLEPAGWFTFWEGLGKVFIHAREKEPEMKFYKKMAHSKVTFIGY
jgi:hypothetical protein